MNATTNTTASTNRIGNTINVAVFGSSRDEVAEIFKVAGDVVVSVVINNVILASDEFVVL